MDENIDRGDNSITDIGCDDNMSKEYKNVGKSNEIGSKNEDY